MFARTQAAADTLMLPLVSRSETVGSAPSTSTPADNQAGKPDAADGEPVSAWVSCSIQVNEKRLNCPRRAGARRRHTPWPGFQAPPPPSISSAPVRLWENEKKKTLKARKKTLRNYTGILFRSGQH